MSDATELFHRVLDTPQPVLTSKADLLGAAHRVHRRRTLLTSAGVAAAVAVVAVGISVLPGQFRPAPAAQHAAAQAAAVPSASPSPAVPRGPETFDQAKARLTAAVRPAAARVRPDAQFVADPKAPAAQGVLQVLDASWKIVPGSADVPTGGFMATALVIDAQGQGTLSLEWSPATQGAALQTPCVASTYFDGAGACSPRTGPHGERMQVLFNNNKFDGDLRNNTVDLFYADGSRLRISSSSHLTGDAHRATPPFSLDQLVDLAASPELTLNP